MIFEILKNIGIGMLNGAFNAALGYAKSVDKESFDVYKFSQTVIVGGIVGGVATAFGVTYEQAYEWAATFGIIEVVERTKKFIWRKFLSKYFE